MRTRAFLSAVLLLSRVSLAADKPLPYPKPLPSDTPLPDPFILADGRKVASTADWSARRTELLALFQQFEYGRIPPESDKVSVSLLISHLPRYQRDVVHSQYKITCGPGGRVTFTLDLLTPKGDGPFPILLTGDGCWGPVADEIVTAILARGYALAQFNRCEFAPDTADQPTGLRPVYADADFGCLAAWAWGYHRAIDALVTLPQVDKSKIAISGHSRGGKCVLLAGATDDRVALVNPNGAGCGGTGCFRDTPPDAETLKVITTKFPFWFKSDFQSKFAGREADLPFDQHELKACVAPRALLDTEGLNDVWANPRGAYRTHLAARKVYDFLGSPGKIAYHIRPGPHEHGLADWTALLDFADQVFFQKKSIHDWNADPFK